MLTRRVEMIECTVRFSGQSVDVQRELSVKVIGQRK
jgi:hypothetical protein